jgi:glucose dehydrogenase
MKALPPEVTQYLKDWPMANKDYNNTRATTDSAIKSGNVNTLGFAWAFDIPGIAEFGAAPTNPLIAGDTVYLQDMKSNVFALDLNTSDKYDIAITKGTDAIIWACGTSDSVQAQHMARGYGEISVD